MTEYELTADTILEDQQRLEGLITEAAAINHRLSEAKSLFMNAADPPASDGGHRHLGWQADHHLRVDHAADVARSRAIETDMQLIQSRREAAIAAGWARHGSYL